jgi:hypothetical protein
MHFMLSRVQNSGAAMAKKQAKFLNGRWKYINRTSQLFDNKVILFFSILSPGVLKMIWSASVLQPWLPLKNHRHPNRYHICILSHVLNMAYLWCNYCSTCR